MLLKHHISNLLYIVHGDVDEYVYISIHRYMTIRMFVCMINQIRVYMYISLLTFVLLASGLSRIIGFTVLLVEFSRIFTDPVMLTLFKVTLVT